MEEEEVEEEEGGDGECIRLMRKTKEWRASFSLSVRTTAIRTERLAVWYRLTD